MQFVAYFWSRECPSGLVCLSVCHFDCPFGWQATVLLSVLGPVWFGQQNVDPWSDVSANLWNMLLMHLLPWLLNLCGKRLWLRLRLGFGFALGTWSAGTRHSVLGTCFSGCLSSCSAYGKSPLQQVKTSFAAKVGHVSSTQPNCVSVAAFKLRTWPIKPTREKGKQNNYVGSICLVRNIFQTSRSRKYLCGFMYFLLILFIYWN